MIKKKKENEKSLRNYTTAKKKTVDETRNMLVFRARIQLAVSGHAKLQENMELCENKVLPSQHQDAAQSNLCQFNPVTPTVVAI